MLSFVSLGSKSPAVYILAACLIALVVASRIRLYLVRRAFKKEHGCQPIQAKWPIKDPIFALDVMRTTFKRGREGKILEGAAERFRRMGCYTYKYANFTTPVISTAEPENIKTVLALRFKDYSLGMRKLAFTPLLGQGIFNADGETWAHSRHIIRPSFVRDQVADLNTFERHIAYLFKAIPHDGSTANIQELFFRFTIDSATEFLFGQSTNSLRVYKPGAGPQEDAAFAEAFAIAQNDVVVRGRLGNLAMLTRNKKAQQAIKVCHEYVDQFVDDAVRHNEMTDVEKKAAGSGEKYIFLHELAKSMNDKKSMRYEALNVLLAGRDTTASLLSNMFFELAKQPAIWTKLREEVAQLDGVPPTYEQLKSLKYLKWCMNESLRIHPVVPGNSRLAERDTVLPLGGGPNGMSPLFVPKGTLVTYSPWTMHRRPEFFGEDVEIFRPERWETLRPGWEYLPFNGGPRICLGQQYALAEAGYVTARLAMQFEKLESRQPGPWKEALQLTLSCGGGTKVGMFAEA
ncbi:cytochrome P450 [Lophium mytilinum]|uniref:Cytochrome P450 n=1 Tax=Lophium mytilinum TaxID=390894 RepID=A0A6A6RAW1_9PEZI|nr:cytochrome P450 [Lophium mytilinum]